MQALQQVREMEWRSLAARTRAHTPLAGAYEAVPLGAVHHGPIHRNLLRARDGRVSTMLVMWRWRQKIIRTVSRRIPVSFVEGPRRTLATCAYYVRQDEAVARLLCGRVEEFTAELPLADSAMEFLAWKEHGRRWTESLMTGVVP